MAVSAADRRVSLHGLQTWTNWPAGYSMYAIGAAIVVMLLIASYFGTATIPPLWLAANLGIVAVYFVAINKVTANALRIMDRPFARKLFWMAWVTRIAAMLILVLIAEVSTERSFYVGAVDATRYHRVSAEMAEILLSGQWGAYLPHVLAEYEGLTDNIGVPLVLGVVYAMFGASPIVGKLFFTLVGSGTVVLVYKTARLLWDESVARLAGIMMAFFPLALFYSSVILKEELVVFLAMLAIYVLTRTSVYERIRTRDVVLIVFALLSIFLVRTAAGALLVSIVATMFLVNRMKGGFIVPLFAGATVLTSFFYLMDVFAEVDYYIDRVEGATVYAEARIQAIAEGNRLATIAGTPVFAALSFIAPFPSMMYLPLGGLPHDDTYYWVGGLIIWNFLIFFGLVGLWKAMRKQLRKSMAVWGFAFGYSIILGVTALFTSVRFGYNAMPVFFALIAVGVAHRREFPVWKIYLVVAVFLIFAWNYFRLAGRGMV